MDAAAHQEEVNLPGYRKPEAVAARLECDDDAVDCTAGLGGFALPAAQ
jgi:hypothetical protein